MKKSNLNGGFLMRFNDLKLQRYTALYKSVYYYCYYYIHLEAHVFEPTL